MSITAHVNFTDLDAVILRYCADRGKEALLPVQEPISLTRTPRTSGCTRVWAERPDAAPIVQSCSVSGAGFASSGDTMGSIALPGKMQVTELSSDSQNWAATECENGFGRSTRSGRILVA